MVLELLVNAAHGTLGSGTFWLTANVEAQVAKDSFSHRSSHQRMVTRSPNHMCESSCSIVSRRYSTVASATLLRKMYSSRNVTQPMFSIAPPLYSGTKIWSYFPNG